MPHISQFDNLLALPKVMLHEHLDCSLRPRTILELMDALGEFPASMPDEVIELWRGDFASKAQAASVYQDWLSGQGSQSLKAYIDCILFHLVPVMQSPENLRRITSERIEDAVADGIIALELRYAPQLSTITGMTLDDVMDAVILPIEDAPIPVKLTICVLRHEDAAMADKLADLAVKYQKHVGGFDLAADEKGNPGVLDWWLPAAVKARNGGVKKLTCHLWETNEPTQDDLHKLALYEIDRIGHGIKGDQQGVAFLEICPTSNIVTGQIADYSSHPIDRLYVNGHLVTVSTDGLTLTGLSGLSHEYSKLRDTFAWGLQHFYNVNVNAVKASSFDEQTKTLLFNQLQKAYL
jgi:adenosine deaminase